MRSWEIIAGCVVSGPELPGFNLASIILIRLLRSKLSFFRSELSFLSSRFSLCSFSIAARTCTSLFFSCCSISSPVPSCVQPAHAYLHDLFLFEHLFLTWLLFSRLRRVMFSPHLFSQNTFSMRMLLLVTLSGSYWSFRPQLEQGRILQSLQDRPVLSSNLGLPFPISCFLPTFPHLHRKKLFGNFLQ